MEAMSVVVMLYKKIFVFVVVDIGKECAIGSFLQRINWVTVCYSVQQNNNGFTMLYITIVNHQFKKHKYT